MTQYIDKSALVAEIESLDALYHTSKDLGGDLFIQGLFCFIDTTEIKEVDLEKELNIWRHEHFNGKRDKDASGEYLERDSQLKLAKHFFELGLNSQQNISIDATDIDKVIEENGVDPNSKEAKMFKESYYVALEKLKAQKGE